MVARILLALLVLASACPDPAWAEAAANEFPESTSETPLEFAVGPRGNPPALFGAELEAPQTLGVGRVGRDVAKHLPALDAMAVHLGDRIAGLGYTRARPVIARDNHEMVDFLRRGIVDLVSETPLSAIHFVREAGATILLSEERRRHREYHSVIFARTDSPVGRLEDLAGHRIAFEDRGSTTSFLLPLAAMKKASLPVAALSSAVAEVPDNTVGYYFTESESAIVTAVMRRSADAGAISNEQWQELRREEPGVASNLRLIHESAEVPRAFLLVGPAVTAENREKLQRILLSMGEDGPGRSVLERYNHVDGFLPLDGSMEDQIRELGSTYQLVQEEVR